VPHALGFYFSQPLPGNTGSPTLGEDMPNRIAKRFRHNVMLEIAKRAFGSQTRTLRKSQTTIHGVSLFS